MSLYTWLSGGDCRRSCRTNSQTSAQAIYPPAYITYNMMADEELVKKAYEEVIRNYLDNATEEQVAAVLERVLAITDVQIVENVEEKVQEAFNSLGSLSEEDIDSIAQ